MRNPVRRYADFVREHPPSRAVIAVGLALSLLWLLAGCDANVSDLDGIVAAKGGNPGKPAAIVDSIRLFPPDTTVAVGESFYYVVAYYIDGTEYLKRGEDGLLYRANRNSGCLIDRPKPIADPDSVTLRVIDAATGESTEPVLYEGINGLPICPR